jgi:uncharacterized membrane protein YbhN (UPF0104 family)
VRALRRIVDGLLVVAMVAGVYLRLPRLGGWAREAAALGHARLAFAVAAIVAQAVSLGCYAGCTGGVLVSLDARLPFRLAFQVTLASFLVSHVTPAGLVTGSALNIAALEIEGIAPATAADAIGVTSLVSSIALIALSGAGLAATAGRHLPAGYLAAAGLARALGAVVLAVTFLMGAHPELAERTDGGGGPAGAARAQEHRPGRGRRSRGRLASLTGSALTGRAFWQSFGLAAADLSFDLLSLDLMFLAFRCQPGFGPLAVAYAAANIASALPLTSGGLGVIEVTLVAITAGFGAGPPPSCHPGLPARQLLAAAAFRRRGLSAPPAPRRGSQADNPRPAGPAQVPAPGPADDGDG